MRTSILTYLTLVFFWAVLMLIIYSLSGCQTPGPTSEQKQIGSLPWKNKDWDKILINEITPKMAAFNSATDIEDYCPKWKALSDESKVIAIAHLFVAIAKFESGYNPGSSMVESTGQSSIGLYQLSFGDRFCPKNKSDGDLTNPSVNIKCAVALAENFVKQDGVIASGGYVKFGSKPPKGLARYWAVIREPDSNRSHKKKEIQNLTRKGCE